MADENFDNEFDELEDFDFDEENESQPIEEENEENFNVDYGFYITEKELCYLYRTNFFVEEIRISR